jgi:hypothetical protein
LSGTLALGQVAQDPILFALPSKNKYVDKINTSGLVCCSCKEQMSKAKKASVVYKGENNPDCA